jgi:SAM-dependent methyltransferase/RimJ/RimL family protein N-acetyltransferase
MLNVELVPLRQEHKSLLYRWRNDPYIISRSGTGKGVAREEHDRWFDRLMQSADTLAYVIEIDGQPAGHLRMERDADGVATISMYLLERFTGAGAGTDAIRLGCSRVALAWPGTPVKAIVLSENMPIRKALTKAGFVTIRVDSEHAEMYWYGAEVKATIERFSARLAEFGAGHRALDWGSESGQRRRFEMLAAIGIGDGASVLDVGCGLGDFNSWLIRAGRDVRYTGLDVTPALLERAAANHPDSEFVLASILDPGVLEGRSFDYVVASGLFYTYRSGGYDWMRAAVEAMWARTGRGLAFNSLSTWAPEAESGEFHADPGQVLALCRRLSPWLDLYHAYHLRDFTVHMFRHVRP